MKNLTRYSLKITQQLAFIIRVSILLLFTSAHAQQSMVTHAVLQKRNVASNEPSRSTISIPWDKGITVGDTNYVIFTKHPLLNSCDTAFIQCKFENHKSSFQSPIVLNNSRQSNINFYPDSSIKIVDCFKDGIDTLGFVFYQATDSVPQSIYLNHLLLGTFFVNPDTASTLNISNYAGKNIDTVYLNSPNEYIFLYARSYDEFGNSRGLTSCNWQTNTLHLIKRAEGVGRVYYESNGSDENGFIKASIVTAKGIQITDSVFVIIRPSAAVCRLQSKKEIPTFFVINNTISYNLQAQSAVKICLFDLLGRLRLTLVDKTYNTGYHQYTMPNNLKAGRYFISFKTANGCSKKPILLTR